MDTPKAITILGRRWFEKTNGNTYFSCRIIVDGNEAHRIAFHYGYGDHYITVARDWLKAKKRLPYMKNNESLWRYCSRKDVDLITDVCDVGRKKDL